jgi:hypothetical protein
LRIHEEVLQLLSSFIVARGIVFGDRYSVTLLKEPRQIACRHDAHGDEAWWLAVNSGFCELSELAAGNREGAAKLPPKKKASFHQITKRKGKNIQQAGFPDGHPL